MNTFRISRQELSSCLGKFIFMHSGKKDSSGAYELSEKCKIILTLPRRLAIYGAEIIIYDESLTKQIMSASVIYKKTRGNNDVYTADIDIKKLGIGLYFGIIKIKTISGELFAIKEGTRLVFSENDKNAGFQLSVSEFEYAAPKGKYGGIIYHIFVDRFMRGTSPYKPHKDAIYIEDWDSEIPEYPKYPGAFLKNNYFYGGTLQGIADKIEYIKSLGVNTIYLSPIFKAYSNHKYDTGDYMQVDESFGGDEALKHLIDTAGKNGIGIILDGVFNHTGADSVYFNRYGTYSSTGAYQSKKSPYYSWYDFQHHPDKYTSWWGIEILPRINPSVKSCADYFTAKNGVIDKYAAMGIDGFRLDVVDELSDNFIKDIKSTLNNRNTSTMLYGEVWEDASNKIAYDKRKTYYLGEELDGVMNYPARLAVIEYIKNNNISEMEYFINHVLPNAPKRIRDAQMNLLGTHDTDRILTLLGGENSDGKSNDYLLRARMNREEYKLASQRLKSAYTLIATIPGIPSIFYGDEAGMEGYHDPFNRRTYPWGREKHDILDFYRKIGRIRRQNSVFCEGNFECLYLSSDLMIFKRYDEASSLLTVISNSDKEVSLSFANPVKGLISDKKSKKLTVPANSSEIVNTYKNRAVKII